MTLTAKHLAAIHYLEARGGRALTDDPQFDASLLNTLYDNDLVMFVGHWGDGVRPQGDDHVDVVVLRYGYRTTLRGLLGANRDEYEDGYR